MQNRKTLSGLFVAPLVAVAIAAPAAPAMPIDEPLRPTTVGAVLKDARQLDMHASTVVKPSAAQQDLRSEAAVDAGIRPQTSTDLRGEAAAAAGKPATEAPLGLPTWPVDPQPITPLVVDEPVATVGDDGLEWPLTGILLAGALLLGGTVGILGAHFRVRQSHA